MLVFIRDESGHVFMATNDPAAVLYAGNGGVIYIGDYEEAYIKHYRMQNELIKTGAPTWAKELKIVRLPLDQEKVDYFVQNPKEIIKFWKGEII